MMLFKISSLLLATTLFSAEVSINKDEKSKQTQDARSGSASSASTGVDANASSGGAGKDYFADEVTYNLILKYEKEKIEKGVTVGKVAPLAYNNIEDGKRLEEIEKITEEQQREKETEKPKFLFTGGYCRLIAPLKVETLAQYASFSCDLEGSDEKVRLTALIQPEHISKALIGRPLYIKTTEGKRFKITDGVIMNHSQTSINLASVVNDYAVERLIAQGGMESSKIVSKYAMEYLLAKQESETTQNVYYGDSNSSFFGIGNQPVVTTNKATPKRRDYVNMAGIELVSKMVDLLGQAWLNKLDFLYEMKADTIYYVDMRIDTNEGMVGVKYNLSDLVHPSPRTLESNRGGRTNNAPVMLNDGRNNFFKTNQTEQKTRKIEQKLNPIKKEK